MKVCLTVTGMHCTSCAQSVQKLIQKNKGVHNVYVNFATNEASFDVDNPDFKIETLLKEIQNLGYHAQIKQEQETDSAFEQEHSLLRTKLLQSSLFAVPLFLLSMTSMFVDMHIPYQKWIELGLCVPVMIIGWKYFGRSAVRSIRNLYPNMDVLITMSSSTAFLYSLYVLLFNIKEAHLYFETAATIITLVILGNWLEAVSIQKTQSALKSLQQLQPSVANLVQKDYFNDTEIVRSVPVKELEIGDIVLVKAGDTIPTDGIVAEGDIEVNESMLTGESIPQYKRNQDCVLSGTLVMQGSAKIKVTQKSTQSLVQEIINLVQKAQQNRPRIQKIGDDIAAIFVPVVIGIALLTFVLSFWAAEKPLEASFLNAVAVLAISCPCAMGLATPTAIMVGVGRASQMSILFKDGRAIENLARIKFIFFDKTGTLTTGNFTFDEVQVLNPKYSKTEIESLFLSFQQHSNHPIAVSMVRHYTQKKVNTVSIQQVESIVGKGVQGYYQGKLVQIGRFNAVQVQDKEVQQVTLWIDQSPVAFVRFYDTLKADSQQTIQYLKSRGIEPILLSGDTEVNCKKVALQLGIEYFCNVLPADKLHYIERYQKSGVVAMVGDGINDAPALKQANVGIAIGSGTQVAIASADVVLRTDKLYSIVTAHQIAQKTVQTIKQNLFWAFFYNSVGIPIAALGWLNPMIGALIMAFSDVVVIGNSLRLRSRKIEA
ncbi:MAG: cation-translocating P-type ATPase [Bacteroidia bacterium]|nr:cation-translocating P-type ATPase [Bacteroidia bacterium]MDW8348050.1 cation-translocating P-type ATPase [Bacteroidia bacterium]